jgi:hypothetical protein
MTIGVLGPHTEDSPPGPIRQIWNAKHGVAAGNIAGPTFLHAGVDQGDTDSFCPRAIVSGNAVARQDLTPHIGVLSGIGGYGAEGYQG